MHIKNNRTLETEFSLDPTEDCVGIVVGDRDETEKNTIKVFIPRFMQGIDIKDGKAVDETASIDSAKLLNSKNKNIGSTSINLKNYIEVPPFLIPGVNPPRYICGERVNIKFVDKDIKSPIYLPYQVHDVILRKEDIIRVFVPSKSDFPDPIVDSNSYFLELNSKEKFVRLYTSNQNEEKCPFTFNINTKDGIVTFRDDTEKRMFEWNYDEDKLYWGTDSGIEFEFKEQAARLLCETLDIKASESINIETSKFKLKSDQGDVIIDNMYVKNSGSFEQETPNAKLKYDMAELSGNLWQIISPGLFFDAPATIHTGTSIMAGYALTKVPAPGKTPSVYAGGCLDGSSPSSSSSPSPKQPDSGAPSSKSSGGGTDTDLKGNKLGKPVAYAEPVIACLKSIAQQADKAMGMAKSHMHPGEYEALAMSGNATEGPAASSEKTSEKFVMGIEATIRANNFKV
jgi:hypothetical protein